MKKFLVIGNPIEHSLSPKLHNYWLKDNNIEALPVDHTPLKSLIDSIPFPTDETRIS